LKLGLTFLTKSGSGQCVPYGLMSIATYLEQKMDAIDVQIIDTNFENVYETIKHGKFDLIGIGSMTIDYQKTIDLAKRIKNDFNMPILVGGHHISSLPSSFKDCFDIGISGEGETTMLELVQLFEKKMRFNDKELEGIKGLIIPKKNDGVFLTERRKPIRPLDEIPIPNRKFINKGYFKRRQLDVWGEFGIESSIITSRGCPYKCIFCSTTRFWSELRFHSPKHAVEEVYQLVENHGVTHIQVWDDLFTIHKKRLREIAKLLREEGLTEKVKFNAQPRANLIDDELCQILKSMNVEIVLFGFESGSERTLKYLKGESISVDDNKNAIKLCQKHGIKAQGSLIFGSPGETLEDMEKTLDFIDFAKKNNVNHLWSFVMTPFPATPIWDIAQKRGKVDDNMDWDLLSHQNIDKPLLLDDDISVEEFKKVFLKGRAQMRYFKWKKILSFIRNSPLETLGIFLLHPIENLKKLFLKHSSDVESNENPSTTSI